MASFVQIGPNGSEFNSSSSVIQSSAEVQNLGSLVERLTALLTEGQEYNDPLSGRRFTVEMITKDSVPLVGSLIDFLKQWEDLGAEQKQASRAILERLLRLLALYVGRIEEEGKIIYYIDHIEQLTLLAVKENLQNELISLVKPSAAKLPYNEVFNRLKLADAVLRSTLLDKDQGLQSLLLDSLCDLIRTIHESRDDSSYDPANLAGLYAISLRCLKGGNSASLFERIELRHLRLMKQMLQVHHHHLTDGFVLQIIERLLEFPLAREHFPDLLGLLTLIIRKLKERNLQDSHLYGLAQAIVPSEKAANAWVQWAVDQPIDQVLGGELKEIDFDAISLASPEIFESFIRLIERAYAEENELLCGKLKNLLIGSPVELPKDQSADDWSKLFLQLASTPIHRDPSCLLRLSNFLYEVDKTNFVVRNEALVSLLKALKELEFPEFTHLIATLFFGLGNECLSEIHYWREKGRDTSRMEQSLADCWDHGFPKYIQHPAFLYLFSDKVGLIHESPDAVLRVFNRTSKFADALLRVGAPQRPIRASRGRAGRSRRSSKAISKQNCSKHPSGLLDLLKKSQAARKALRELQETYCQQRELLSTDQTWKVLSGQRDKSLQAIRDRAFEQLDEISTECVGDIVEDYRKKIGEAYEVTLNASREYLAREGLQLQQTYLEQLDHLWEYLDSDQNPLSAASSSASSSSAQSRQQPTVTSLQEPYVAYKKQCQELVVKDSNPSGIDNLLRQAQVDVKRLKSLVGMKKLQEELAQQLEQATLPAKEVAKTVETIFQENAAQLQRDMDEVTMWLQAAKTEGEIQLLKEKYRPTMLSRVHSAKEEIKQVTTCYTGGTTPEPKERRSSDDDRKKIMELQAQIHEQQQLIQQQQRELEKQNQINQRLRERVQQLKQETGEASSSSMPRVIGPLKLDELWERVHQLQDSKDLPRPEGILDWARFVRKLRLLRDGSTRGDLEKLLEAAGFEKLGGKGSHTNFRHALLPTIMVTLAAHGDGSVEDPQTPRKICQALIWLLEKQLTTKVESP